MGGIGILGGTFDPPHIGHLAMAEYARQLLQLDQILFMPVGQPVHKTEKRITDASHRIHMTRLAIANNLWFQLDKRDVERDPPHSTVSLLPLLQASWPNQQLWLIIGADSLVELPTWIDPEGVTRQAKLAVAPRPQYEPNLAALEGEIPGLSHRVSLLDAPALSVSSTDIRRRIGLGQNGRYLVPDPVLDYLHQHDLYTFDSKANAS